MECKVTRLLHVATTIIQIVKAIVRLEIKEAEEKRTWGMPRKRGVEKREDFQDSSWIKRLTLVSLMELRHAGGGPHLESRLLAFLDLSFLSASTE